MTEPDFKSLKKITNGMLPVEAYRAVYETARKAGDGRALEVGTAHGAATICLALGLRDGGNPGRVITIDKIEGGSRAAFGSVEENLRIIHGNFERFGVSESIELHVGSSSDVAPALHPDLRLGLLMLDADGAIDRDVALFYNALRPGSPVIIDDYGPDAVRLYRHGRRVRTDQKRRLTALLVDYFMSKGLLELERIVGETWFGRKPAGIARPVTFDFAEIAGIYRKLIFSDAILHNQAAELIGALTRRFPGLHRVLKTLYTGK